jgi:hypothetical protein
MINKILPRQLDSTTDLKLTAENAMVDALNVRYTVNETSSNADGDDSSGDAGVLKNIKGNVRANYLNPWDKLIQDEEEVIKFRTLGSVVDNKAKIIYFFVWSSRPSEHGIYAYDPYGKLPKNKTNGAGLKNSVRLIMKSSEFKFQPDSFVSADIVHVNMSEFARHDAVRTKMIDEGIWDDMNTDTLIYFTDNNNEPRKVNAYRALLNNQQQSTGNQGYASYSIFEMRDLICACPRTPLHKIDFEFGQDPNFAESNFKNTNSFQFAYQFVYRDGIESSISPYSLNAVPVVLLEQGSNTAVNYITNNVCVLTVPEWNKEVEFVKILVREGDNGSWLVLDEVSTTESSENWLFSSRNYKFYNNKVLTGVSAEEVAKQFDNVPKMAQCQVVSNNRLFYGNYVDGFDNVKVEAKITPLFSERDTERDTAIKIISGIRPHAEWRPDDPISNKIQKNRMYNGGSNYIIDAREATILRNGDVVEFNLSIAPDRNFHIYRKGTRMPSADVKTADRYYNGDPFYEEVNENGENREYFHSRPESEFAGYSKSIWGYTPIKSNVNYRYFHPIVKSDDVLSKVKFGSSPENPLIIKGGQLSFSVSFKYNGEDVDGENASNVIGLTVAELLSGTELTYSDQIEVITNNNQFVYSLDLGLNDFDKIKNSRGLLGCNALGEALEDYDEPDPRANLICAIGDENGFDSNVVAGSYINGPCGYFIVNKAKVRFSFDFVKKANNTENSVCELLLNIDKIEGIDAFTCLRSPQQLSSWYVVSKNTLAQNNAIGSETAEGIVSEIADTDINDFLFTINPNQQFANDWSDFSSNSTGNEIKGARNYLKQFGYLDLEEINEQDLSRNKWSFEFAPDVNKVGVCVTDGEVGPGGIGGSATYNSLQLYKHGSVSLINNFFPSQAIAQESQTPEVEGLSNYEAQILSNTLGGAFAQSIIPISFDINNVYSGVSSIGTNGGLLYAIGGTFFTGHTQWTVILPDIVANDELFVTNQSQTYEISKRYGIVIQNNAVKCTTTPLTKNNPGILYLDPSEYDQAITHAEVEIVQYNSSLNFFYDYSGYRSFKANSMHDFGIIFYDERGRHGFVNPIGSLYVPGYSDQERGAGNKGKVDVLISPLQVPQAPFWARYYQYAHTRSTSISDFIQYSSGGGFVKWGGDQDQEKNIYVSLNYLQTSIVSYMSAFGARSPEGGVQIYKHRKGDRLRVLSYKDSDGSTIYPNNFDFEIVDVVNLGDSENPLHQGETTPPFNKMGEFVILKDNLAAYPFNYGSVGAGSGWDQNCIIEIYSPSKVSEQGQKIYYEIGPVQKVVNDGVLPQTILANGDVWWRKVAVNFREFENGVFNDLLINTEDSGGSNSSKSNFKSYYLETKTFTDLVRGDSIGVGRPNSVLKSAKETRNESSVTYSDPTAASSYRSFYSSFNQSLFNYKDIPDIYGSVNFLIDRGDSILVIQEDKVCYLPISRNLLSDNANNEFLVSSTEILGTPRFYAGKAGCDNNPESVVDVDGIVYFVHKSTGKVFKVTSTGIEDVSSEGMSSYLRNVFQNILNTSAYVSKLDIKVIGGYDPLNEEYLFTIKRIDAVDRGAVALAIGNKSGCRNPAACNYDPEAVIDDGSCVFAIPGRDCDGKCLEDEDGDGICDDRDPVIWGCTDPAACNYDPKATNNPTDGQAPSCYYSTDEFLDCDGNCIEFHPDTNFGNLPNAPYKVGPLCKTEPLVRGCTVPEYDSYDPNATYPYNSSGLFLCYNLTPPTLGGGGEGPVVIGGGGGGIVQSGDGGAVVTGGDAGTALGDNGGIVVTGSPDPFVPQNTVVVNTVEKFIEYNGLKLSDIKEVFKFTQNKADKLHQAFNLYDFDGDNAVTIQDMLQLLSRLETDVNTDYVIPPTRPSGEALTEQINQVMSTALKLHEAYVVSRTQVAPLYDVNVQDYLMYLAGLAGPPQSIYSSPSSTLSTTEENAVSNLLDFLAGNA